MNGREQHGWASLSKSGLHKSCSEGKGNCSHTKAECHLWLMRDFSILLPFLSISWHWFQSFPSSISAICSHQPVNAMVTFPLNATASLPPPETFSFTILDCSASRFQHTLNLTAYFQHVKKSNLTPKYLSHPPAVPIISVFKDSVLHYCLQNKNVIDVIQYCVCCG